jgi:hypothetical protein
MPPAIPPTLPKRATAASRYSNPGSGPVNRANAPRSAPPRVCLPHRPDCSPKAGLAHPDAAWVPENTSRLPPTARLSACCQRTMTRAIHISDLVEAEPFMKPALGHPPKTQPVKLRKQLKGEKSPAPVSRVRYGSARTGRDTATKAVRRGSRQIVQLASGRRLPGSSTLQSRQIGTQNIQACPHGFDTLACGGPVRLKPNLERVRNLREWGNGPAPAFWSIKGKWLASP